MRLKGISILLLAFLLSACTRSAYFSGGVTLPMPLRPETTNRYALAIYDALPIYVAAARMSWSPLESATPLRPGKQYAVVPDIRRRLIVLQDMPSLSTHHASQSLYDRQLVQGVGHFQARHSLPVTGVIDAETLQALNVTPMARYHELLQSMHQWARFPEDKDSRYVLVNIPAYQLQLVEYGYVMLKTPVIVGRPTRPTPTLTSKIVTVVFNPTWTVPKTILSRDVIPGMRKNPQYLQEHYGMKLYVSYEKNAQEVDPNSIDWQQISLRNFPYRVTAPSGPKNPLGQVKFIFNNAHDVYLHDTSEKSLFSLRVRARSSGCVRVKNPMMLVHYFGQDNSDLKPALVAGYLSTLDTKYVALSDPMPIHIVYILNWVNDQGKVIFGRDIYGVNKPKEEFRPPPSDLIDE